MKKLLVSLFILALAIVALVGCDFSEYFCIHQWGEWEIVEGSTCESTGTIERICTLCRACEEKVLASKKHVYANESCLYCHCTDEKYFNFTYIEGTDSYSISSQTGCELPSKIVIPSTYNGKMVTDISDYAFANNESITDVKIGKGITSIGDYAFWVCSNIEYVEIGEDVKIIGVNAFRDCASLRSLVIPDSVEVIDSGAFAYCSNLQSVELGSGVEYIGYIAFYRCYELKSATFRDDIYWFVSEDSGVTKIPVEVNIQDSKTLAVWLMHTYAEHHWYKE